MEKKIIVLVGALMMALFSFADTYKVLFVNSNAIKIGSKQAVVGMIFSDKDIIIWSNSEQAIKVVDLTTKRGAVLTAKALTRHKASSVYDYLTSKKHLSTRDLKGNRIMEEWQIDSTLYLLDTIKISRPQTTSKTVVANAVDENGNVIDLPVSEDGKYFIITNSIYNGEPPRSKHIDIKEYDKERDWKYTVYRNLIIEPVGRKI